MKKRRYSVTIPSGGQTWQEHNSITVVVGKSPYGHERPYTALRFVLAALVAGHQVYLLVL